MSNADYQNSSKGLYTAIAVIVIATSLLTLIGITSWLHELLLWFTPPYRLFWFTRLFYKSLL